MFQSQVQTLEGYIFILGIFHISRVNLYISTFSIIESRLYGGVLISSYLRASVRRFCGLSRRYEFAFEDLSPIPSRSFGLVYSLILNIFLINL